MNRTMLAMALVAAFISTGAQAADPTVQCEVAKLRQVARHSSCMLRAFSRNVERDEPGLSGGKCEIRFIKKVLRVHNKYEGYCANNNDIQLLHVLTLSYAHQVAGQLDGE